jgi:hypothetical protein
MRFGQRESLNACLLCRTEERAEWVQVKLQTRKSTTRSDAQRDSTLHGATAGNSGSTSRGR